MKCLPGALLGCDVSTGSVGTMKVAWQLSENLHVWDSAVETSSLVNFMTGPLESKNPCLSICF